MSELDFPGEELDFPGEEVGKGVTEESIEKMVQPIPDVRKPPLVEGERGITMGREATVGSGAMLGGIQGAEAGAAMGAPLGPGGAVAGGIIGGTLGGALGAAGGSYLDDMSKRLLQTTSDLPVDSPQEYLKRSTKRALKEAGYDFGLSTLAGTAGQVTSRIGKPLMGAMLGVRGPEAAAARRAAHGAGVDVGVSHVTRFSVVKSASRVFGIFPLIGKAYVEGQKRVVGQLDDVGADLLNTIAPKSMEYDVSQALVTGAKKRYDKFVNLKAAFYDKFDKIADNLSVPDVVPTENIRKMVNEISVDEAKEAIKLADGTVMQRFKNDEFGIFLAQLSNFPNYLTVRQARGLQREINQLAQNSKLQGYDISRMGQLSEEIKAAINNLDTTRLPEEEAAEVVAALNKANDFYHSAKGIFETKTAKKLGRVEENIFAPGVDRPGTITEDEVFKTTFESRNPTALHDLRRIVGNNPFKKAVREHLDNAVEASIVKPKEGSALKDPLFSADKFEKNLRLDTEEGWAALSEMLKGTGTNPKDFARFLQSSKVASDIVIRDPSTFIVRRIILMGATSGAVMGSVAAGGGQASIPAAIFITWALRQAGKKLMDPVFLRDITGVISDGVPNFQKRAMMLRLMHAIPKEDQ